MKNKLIILLIVIIVIAVIFAGTTNITSYFSTESTAANSKSSLNAEVKEFTIESFTKIIDGNYYPQFSLSEINVKKGDLVRLKITNTKGMHDFKIDEFSVYAETPLDQEVIVEFVASKAGEFEYYCTKTGHRQLGQWGTLKVTA